ILRLSARVWFTVRSAINRFCEGAKMRFVREISRNAVDVSHNRECFIALHVFLGVFAWCLALQCLTSLSLGTGGRAFEASARADTQRCQAPKVPDTARRMSAKRSVA